MYVVTGPLWIDDSSGYLVRMAVERAQAVIERARLVVAGAAELSSMREVGCTLTDEDGLAELEFIEDVFDADLKKWVEEFIGMWNDGGTSCADFSARPNPDAAGRAIAVAGDVLFGSQTGKGWRMMHTATLLGVADALGLK